MAKDIDEVVDSIKDGVKKRFESSFIVSFAISFFITNYKLFLVIFGSGGDFDTKIFFIEEFLYPDTWWKLAQLAIIPSAAAFAYTLLWPLIDTEIVAAANKLENRKKERLLILQQQEPVPKDEQAAYFSRYNREIDEYRSRLIAAKGQAKEIAEMTERQFFNLRGRINLHVWNTVGHELGGGVGLFKHILSTSPENLKRKNPELFEATQKVRCVDPLAKTILTLRLIQPDDYNVRACSLETLQSILKPYEDPGMYVVVYEILRTLELLGPINENNNSFVILNCQSDLADNIVELNTALRAGQNSPAGSAA